jgi:hypothetical protein
MKVDKKMAVTVVTSAGVKNSTFLYLKAERSSRPQDTGIKTSRSDHEREL